MDWSACSFNSNGITVAKISCLPPLLTNIIYWLIVFVGTVAVVFIIVGGIRFIISGGDPKKLDQARKTIAFSILGLVLVFLSFFIINFIAGVTGVGCIDFSKPLSFTSCK